MLYIEKSALEFTPYRFLRWLLIRRENDASFYDKEKTIEVWFQQDNTKAVILDVDCNWYKISLSNGVQKCVFKCYWIHELGQWDCLYGKKLEDILELLAETQYYGHKYGTKENELIE